MASSLLSHRTETLRISFSPHVHPMRKRNALDAAEAASPLLEHVHLVQGTKWYGMHLGNFKTPARENDPRHLPPNFYYNQQDLIIERQEGKQWTWSASRPYFLIDFAPD